MPASHLLHGCVRRHAEVTCVFSDQSDLTQCSIELRHPVGFFFSDRCRLHISICRARMLTWQCGSHPALSQCSIELPHPVFVTSLHRSVDEATLVGVFFLAAGKDVSNPSSRAKSSAWCCRPRQHSVFFFPDGRHRFGCCTYFYAGMKKAHVFLSTSDWTQCSIELRQPVGQSVCLCVYRTATGLVFQALMLTPPGRSHPALSQCSIQLPHPACQHFA